MEELEQWHAAGIQTFLETGSGGEAYFGLQLRHAEEVLRAVSARVDLAHVSPVLNMYVKALTGTNVSVAPESALAEKGIGWVSEGAASTEGTTIYLPDHIDTLETRAANFAVYKVYATHQAAHIEFGSFGFVFAR